MNKKASLLQEQVKVLVKQPLYISQKKDGISACLIGLLKKQQLQTEKTPTK